jgi:hypothetical protein
MIGSSQVLWVEGTVQYKLHSSTFPSGFQCAKQHCVTMSLTSFALVPVIEIAKLPMSICKCLPLRDGGLVDPCIRLLEIVD